MLPLFTPNIPNYTLVSINQLFWFEFKEFIEIQGEVFYVLLKFKLFYVYT